VLSLFAADPTLPPRGKSAEIFLPIHGGPGLRMKRRPAPIIAAENPRLAARKPAPQFCLRFVSTNSHEVNVGGAAGADNWL
jgi:hypothetical protein